MVADIVANVEEVFGRYGSEPVWRSRSVKRWAPCRFLYVESVDRARRLGTDGMDKDNVVSDRWYPKSLFSRDRWNGRGSYVASDR